MKNIKIIIGIVAVLAVLVYLGFSGFFSKQNYEFVNENKGTLISASEPAEIVKEETDDFGDDAVAPYGQEDCKDSTKRSIAVMLATDAITRPLSGISQADIVFEMPVITDSVTRLMAVYSCTVPIEIGSIRSARHDFIDLANSVDAIYVHWGGSHYALDRLKTDVIDNFDALTNFYSVFYRKNTLLSPHNGFTNGEKILIAAEKLKYRVENNFKGFARLDCEKGNDNSDKCKGAADGILKIGYPGEFRVEYQYDATTNLYLRWRGGKKEIDRNNNKQVTAKNVVVLFADYKQLEPDYNDMALEGQGKAEFYINGVKTEGVWKKNSFSPKFYYLDSSGSEIKFAIGNIWVEIMQTNQKTEWLK